MKPTRLTRFTPLAAVMLAVMLAVAIAACGPDQSREDARDVTVVDKSPPEVVTFNNHFANVEQKCDGHGHRIYQTSDEHGSRVMIYPDPTCPGYQADGQPVVVLGRP